MRKQGPQKYCLACCRKIPLMAHRCPYCREEGQTVHGRLFLILLFIGFLMLLAHFGMKENINTSIEEWQEQQVKGTSNRELVETLKGVL